MKIKAFTNNDNLIIDVSSNNIKYLCRRFIGYKIDKFLINNIIIENKNNIEDLIEILKNLIPNLKGIPSGFDK